MSARLPVRLGSVVVAAAALLVVAAPRAQAQGLGLIERFGPDGLPFTQDDPLHVGGSASRIRFGAMAADNCSEERSLSGGGQASHGHTNQTHPGNPPYVKDLGRNKGHKARPTPGDYEGNNFVTQAPFDFTLWITGTTLHDGRLNRFRAFPEDTTWTNQDNVNPDRGWVTGWSSEDQEMDQVTTSGIKNLHLETMGLGYRDLKPNHGLPIAIKYETLDQFPDFQQQAGDKFSLLDMGSQQAYCEAWVAELMNLDNNETGISGNFVLDLSGLEIHALMALDQIKEKQFGVECKVDVAALPIDLGGPLGTTGTYSRVTPYFLAEKWPDLWPIIKEELRCEVPLLGEVDPPDWAIQFFEGKARDKVADELARLDRGIDKFELIDADIYEQIQNFSGMAGETAKNPFDKVALAAMTVKGGFEPDLWTRWQRIDEQQLMIGFEPPAGFQVTSTKEELQNAGTNWRYNSGSSYIGKGSMMFGNSRGEDPNRLDIMWGGNGSNFNRSQHDAAKIDMPDIFWTYAQQWLYVRMDIIDPYIAPEQDRVALWIERDIVIPQEENPPLPIDWPPPNYFGGRSQVITFRAASGGEIVPENVPDAPGGQVVSVDPETALIWKGLISIDPKTRTYAVAGALFKADDPTTAWYFGQQYPIWGTNSNLTWSEPREMPQWPGEFLGDTGYRWLTAAANHYTDEVTNLRWAWDFDTSNGNGQIDSVHGQHFSETGSARWGGVFSFQPNHQPGGGGKVARGRTGFSLVNMQGMITN